MKLYFESDYSETDEFEEIKNIAYWVDGIKKLFIDDKDFNKKVSEYYYRNYNDRKEDRRQRADLRVLRRRGAPTCGDNPQERILRLRQQVSGRRHRGALPRTYRQERGECGVRGYRQGL